MHTELHPGRSSSVQIDGTVVECWWIPRSCRGKWSSYPCVWLCFLVLFLTRFPLESYSEDWSDSDEDELDDANTDPNRKIKVLEKKLALARQSLGDYRALVAEKLDITKQVENLTLEEGPSDTVDVPKRDDDTHYFESYGANGMFVSRWFEVF